MIRKVLASAATFADQQRQKAVDDIVSSGVWGIIFKWAITHWVTLLATVIVGGYFWHVHLLNEQLRDLQLQQEIQQLNLNLEQMNEEKAALLKRVNDLEGGAAAIKQSAQKLKKALQGLPPDQLQKKLSDYVSRLKKERGYDQ